MVVHKGLGIKVKSREKGKGNQKLGDHNEDYSIVISVRNRIQLRDEWRLVDIMMLDECSLSSAEIISEIDSALRFAKEKPDQWFGGIITGPLGTRGLFFSSPSCIEMSPYHLSLITVGY
jgi:hypothetical protein